ncbi:MAG: hypothetical protein NTW04_03330, partial [Elusimicrobia bacterium]|nr:hypothetical protein [Elusimicrobiota bacterium]
MNTSLIRQADRLFLCAIFALLSVSARAEDFPEPGKGNIPAAVLTDAAPQTRGETESKLMTDMFFAGSLADKMLKVGTYPDGAGVRESDAYSGARAKLILWIRKNPKEAAEISAQISSRADEGSFKIAAWRIKKEFLDMIKELSETSKNTKLSPEETSFFNRLIFEGRGYYEGKITLASSIGYSGLKAKSYLFPPSWNLNLKNLEEEKKTAGNWLSALSERIDYDKRIAAENLTPQDMPMSRREKLFSQAVEMYQSFVSFSSRFVGR